MNARAICMMFSRLQSQISYLNCFRLKKPSSELNNVAFKIFDLRVKLRPFVNFTNPFVQSQIV